MISRLNSDIEERLYNASGEGWGECKRILQSYPNVNPTGYRGVHGWRALHVACGRGALDVVRMMLQSTNVNINVTNNYGWTSLDCAIDMTHNELVDLLIQNGATANQYIKNENGKWI